MTKHLFFNKWYTFTRMLKHNHNITCLKCQKTCSLTGCLIIGCTLNDGRSWTIWTPAYAWTIQALVGSWVCMGDGHVYYPSISDWFILLFPVLPSGASQMGLLLICVSVIDCRMYRVDTWKFIVKGLELLALPVRVRERLGNKQLLLWSVSSIHSTTSWNISYFNYCCVEQHWTWP